MKKLIAWFLAACTVLALAGCGKKETAGNVRLGALKGPTSMGLVKLLEDDAEGKTENDYSFQMAAAADELTPLLLKGELDILVAPLNLGAILHQNSGGEVRLLAVSTLGVLHLVESGGETVQDWADLKGKTIYATGKGTTPEYALRYLLEQYGLDPDTDVTFAWKSEPTEIVAQMALGEPVVAMLPQPFVTVAKGQIPNLRVVFDLTEQWDALENGSRLLTAGVLVRKAFLEENPGVVETFLKEFDASVTYLNENVAEGAVLVEKYGIVKAAVAEKAIPGCHVVCITGEEMESAVRGYYQTLFDQNPAAVGGELPEDDYYAP